MKKIIISTLLVVSMVMVMFAGCGQKAADSGIETGNETAGETGGEKEEVKKADFTIGFVPMTLNNEYFIAMCNGAQEKANELGVKIEVQAADSHASAADQLTIVENMITSGVNAICIVPSSSEGLETALKKCEDAGILVFNIDTMLDETVTSKV
jgi:ribose transport system substrate-binding protein